MPPALIRFFSVLLLLMPATTLAETPRIIQFQGMLTADDGSPLTGTYSITFAIYDQAEGGTSLWSESKETEAVDGLLSVMLGLDDEIDLQFSEQYWLGISVGDDDEMEPRYRLAGAPYSLWAAVADSAVSTHWSGISGTPAGFADGVDNVGAVGDGHSLDASDSDPADALFVDDEGNIGIGTTSPDAELEIAADAPSLKLSSATSTPEFLFHTDGASAYDWRLKVLGNDLIAETSPDDGASWLPLLRFDGSGIDRGSFYIYDGYGTAGTNRIFEFDAYDHDGRCIWGDKTLSVGDLVLKSNDDVKLHLNQSGDNTSLFQVISAAGFSVFNVDEGGDMWATGAKSAIVTSEMYGDRKLYSIESPEVWFEDFGTSRLVDGSITIEIEPVFASTVSLDEDYRVFITPVDGYASLYVTEKNATSFKVIDAEGVSDISFDYRIVARRKGYEDVRLEEGLPQGD